jgi:methylmalonyl-CoA decarboxylase subunit alpha
MTEVDPRILELRARRDKVHAGGGAERVARQHAKGKLTARERIEYLLDPGSFQEMDTFAMPIGDEECLPVERTPGDGVVTGFGQVEGRTVFVYAQDFTVQGGAVGEMHSRKICRVMDLAVQNGAPIIGLIDSGGARIQEGVHSLGGYGEIFRRNAQYSGIVPQISLMMGPCAGGAAYSPALTDILIMVEKTSYMFLTGPEVIKTVTGEVIDAESLGGANVHLAVSGTTHFSAATDQEALVLARKVLSYLPSNHLENPPFQATEDDPRRMDDALNTLVPLDPTLAYSMIEGIEHVVDRGSFLELQAGYARNAVVGLARMDGFPVGIVAQEPSVMAGVIDIDAADKITRFVRLCDCYNLPIVTFVDSPGFLPGVDQEHRGIIRHGAKVLFAYSEASVPKISVVTRKAYGGAYVVMSSKYLGTDVNLAWPSAEIAVMGPEGAANILYRKQIETAADPAKERIRLAKEYQERFLNPFVAAGAGAIDDIIEPRETRARLVAALASLRSKYQPSPSRRHGNIPV